ncbi:glucose PTS transporter subunit IIA [Yokenella regensburgei]|uniref:glucose PTS transporter subunit IIA n=1 Tax=Yokenella regensburgei TaxID=158877 RepID=UPI003F172FA3
MKYENESKEIVSLVGGKENIQSVVHCATRLRFSLKDSSLAKGEALKKLPWVLTAVESGGQYQIVIGSAVAEYYEAILAVTGKDKQASGEGHDAVKSKRFSMDAVFEIISSAFSPLIPAMAGSGMLKAVLTVLVEAKLLSDASDTYAVLSAASNAIFYFLPVFLGITLANKIGGNMYVGGTLGAALMEPTFTALIGKADTTFLGISLTAVNYATTIFPIFIAIFIYAWLDKLLKRIIYKEIQLFAVPLISLMIMVPFTALFFGPFGTVLGNGLSHGVMWLINQSKLLSGIVIGGGMPFMVMLGLHWGFSPVTLENLRITGGDPIEGMAVASVFAQIGVAMGFWLRARKHSKMRALTGPVILTGLLAGVTEPIVYGLILRYKRLMVIVALAGAIGGAICGVTGVTMNAYVFHNVFSIPVYTPKLGYFTGVLAAMISGAVLAWCFGVKKGEEGELLPDVAAVPSSAPAAPAAPVATATTPAAKNGPVSDIFSPLRGEVIPLSEIPDDVFSSGVVGQGVGIIPLDNSVYAPFDGVVSSMFPSRHAIGVTSDKGDEVLIHVGINTVHLNGRCFTPAVKVGDHFSAGQVLMTFDREAIAREGLSLITPVIYVDDRGSGGDLHIEQDGRVSENDILFKIIRHR